MIIKPNHKNGASFDELIEHYKLMVEEKDKEQREIEITNLILEFIKLNPDFADKLKINNRKDKKN